MVVERLDDGVFVVDEHGVRWHVLDACVLAGGRTAFGAVETPDAQYRVFRCESSTRVYDFTEREDRTASDAQLQRQFDESRTLARRGQIPL